MATYRVDGITMPDGNDYDFPVFIAEYGVTAYEDLLEAYNAGFLLFCVYSTADYYKLICRLLAYDIQDRAPGSLGDFRFNGLISNTGYLAATCYPNNTWTYTMYSVNIPLPATGNTYLPKDLGSSAAVGNFTHYARADHIHKMPSASDVGAIAAPASPSTGDFLVWNGTAWAAQSLSTWQGGNY